MYLSLSNHMIKASLLNPGGYSNRIILNLVRKNKTLYLVYIKSTLNFGFDYPQLRITPKVMPLRKFVVEMYLFFFWMISLSVLGENTYFPGKYFLLIQLSLLHLYVLGGDLI